MVGTVDYDALWTSCWCDTARFGPVPRHGRRIMARMIEGINFDSVLDVGCGEGSTLAFLKGKYSPSDMAGIDISRIAIERARRNLPGVTWFIGKINTAISGRTYDLVTCVDVLEHVEDDILFLRDLAAVSNRYVLCVTAQGKMREGEAVFGHVRNYCRGELHEKMQSAGLRPIRTVQWGFPFYSPLMRRTLESKGGELIMSGHFGLIRKLACCMVYGLLMLNSWHHGDKLFVLAEKKV